MFIRATERAARRALPVGLLGLLGLGLVGCAAAPRVEPPVYATQAPRAAADVEPATQPAEAATTTAPESATAAAPSTEAAPVPAPGTVRHPLNEGDFGEVVPTPEYRPLPLTFSLTGSYLYAPVTGYAQVPSGGKVGTSSSKQPTFRKLGVNDINIGDGELTIGVHDYGQFFVGAQYIHDSGSSIIQHPLTTHGITFPKGTHIDGSIQLDWYRVGYRYPITLHNTLEGRPDVVLAPWADAVFWDFAYDVNGGSAGKTSRSFTKPGAQVGADLIWAPGGGPLSLEATLASFPQISSMATISQERFLVRYRFYQWRRYDFAAHIGVEWEQQNFKDSQPLSNHINASFGPMLVTGLSIGF